MPLTKDYNHDSDPYGLKSHSTFKSDRSFIFGYAIIPSFMSGNFGITYKQALPKVFLPAGPSATKHGPNTKLSRIAHELKFLHVCSLLW
jgi:hypothetical protein